MLFIISFSREKEKREKASERGGGAGVREPERGERAGERGRGRRIEYPGSLRWRSARSRRKACGPGGRERERGREE